MVHGENVNEIRARLEHYRRTRSTTAESMHRWLDALIADAEEKLRQLAPTRGAGVGNPATTTLRSAPAPHLVKMRSTYPFAEDAPRQRIL